MCGIPRSHALRGDAVPGRSAPDPYDVRVLVGCSKRGAERPREASHVERGDQDLPLQAGEVITTTITYILYFIQDRLYDPLYRLTDAEYSSGEFFEYTYDAVGNRLSEVTAAGCTTYAYDVANRLTGVNGVTYTWDANGNLLDDGENTYEYNSTNRLISVANPQATIGNQYNGLGDRV